MKKQILIAFFVILLTLSVFASEPALLIDEADLLTDSEESALLSKLEDIRSRESMDVVIVTVDSIGYYTAEEYADDFYDYNGYADDGILLLISMEERDWHISTAGYGITAITDAGLEYISDKFMSDLSNGDYYDAFSIFAEQCELFIEQADTGEPFDVYNLPKEPFDAFWTAIFSFAVGLVIALIVTSVMKGQLKSVRAQAAADSYVKGGSLNITNAQEIFLYRNISRVARETGSSGGRGGSSTHMSSSGRTHGGRGGKF